jgi:hypothetical protein
MAAFTVSTDLARALKHLRRFQESRTDHLAVIYYLAAEGSLVPRDELVEQFAEHGDPAAMLRQLQSAGLVRSRRLQSAGHTLPVVALADDLQPLFQLPPFYRNRLRYRLAGRDLADLRRMAEGFYAGSPRPVPEESRNPVDLLASFKALLLDAQAFRAAADEHFSLARKAILKALSMAPAGLTLRDLRKQLSFFGLPHEADEVKRELVQIYRASGLIWTSEGDSLLKHDHYFPVEARVLLMQDAQAMVRANYRLEQAPRQVYPTFAGDSSPEAWKVRHEPALLFQNALVLLGYLIGHRVQRIQKGGVHKGEVKRIAAQFQPPQEDPHLFNHLFDTFEQLGVVRCQHDIWAVDVPRAAAFFADPVASLQALLRDYYEADLCNPKACEERMEAPDSGIHDPLRLIWLLRHMSGQAWVREEELVWLYLQTEGGKVSESARAGIERFVRHQLEKHLFWFGLVELATRPEEGGLLFRLSGRGRSLLHELVPDDSLARLYNKDEKLLVQANLEVFLPASFDPAGVLFLARFADAERGRFRLSAQSLSRGLDSGLGLEKIRGFLEAASSQPIPQNVAYLLEEVSSRHGHILVDPKLMVLKTEDRFLMKELCLVPALRRSYLALLDEQLLLLAPGLKVPRLVEELRRLGYMPRVRWEAVIDEGMEQLELSAAERHRLLSLLKAYDYADAVHPRLGELFEQVVAQLAPEEEAERRAIPQRQLGDSYKDLERLNRALGAGRLS